MSDFLLNLRQSLAHQGFAKILDISTGMSVVFAKPYASRSQHISSQKIAQLRLKLEKEILGKLNRVWERDPDILFAYLFGSTASGLEHPYSDLDIACYVREGDEKYYHEKDRELREYVPDIISGHKVDVHLLNTMPTLLKFEVVRYGKEIFVRDQSAKAEFETTTLYRYFDMRPFLTLYYSLLEERIRSTGR